MIRNSKLHREMTLPPAIDLNDHKSVIHTVEKYIFEKPVVNGDLNILEAGCGRRWSLSLSGIKYILTGIDIDQHALDIRKNLQKDLDHTILADLRTVTIPENSYDVIYCENVLEHINGAEGVIKNFTRWLKPGGTMVLIFPNKQSAYGFITRVTPLWVHIFYKKYIQGIKNAGKPGHDPFPVSFDSVLNRLGIFEFCAQNDLVVKAEYRMDGRPMNSSIMWSITKTILWGLHIISFKKLSVDHKNLIYIIEKAPI